MSEPLLDLLQRCTVRLTLPEALGTGFFVAPGRVLTCAHVVQGCQDQLGSIKVGHSDRTPVVLAVEVLPTPYPDLALLHIDWDDHPCVYLDARLESGQLLYAYGYTRDSPGGEAVTVEYEGPARLDGERWLLKFKGGQIIPGYSGSPLLNRKTLSVCGVMKSTRDRLTDLGGGGIPTAVVVAKFPGLIKLQQMFHGWDKGWIEASRQQRSLEAGTGLPQVVITAEVAPVQRATAIVEIEEEQLAPEAKLSGLWSPQSLDWYADNMVALGSRDSRLRVAGLDGRIAKEFTVTSYPSFVAVHDQRLLAAVCYTRLYLANLQTDELRSVEVDANASSRSVAWAPNGEYIAVAATNTLKLFRADLTLVAERHVAGKHGAAAVAWHPKDTVLYVGLGNGELWRLTPPFNEAAVLCTGASPLIALRCGPDGRLACLWRDGRLEVRRDGEALYAIVSPGHDTWSPNGPKLAWCLNGDVIASVTGVSNELVLWDVETGRLLTCRLARRVLAVDAGPSGADLLLGLDEDQKQDGLVSIVSGSRLTEVIATAPSPRGTVVEPHLLTADWTRLLELARDRRDSLDPAYDLRLAIPLLEQHFGWYEETVRKWDAEIDIKRQLTRRLVEAKQRAADMLGDLQWAADQMQQAGYYESQLSVACDHILSFVVNAILARLAIPEYPPIEQLDDFVAFTLGVPQTDLIDLGFDTDDGGVQALVPIDFLLGIERLVAIGDALAKKKNGAKTMRQKVFLACQLVRDFDYAFGSYEQRDLWSRYVLPQTIARYPREQVIFRPSDVRTFGLA